MSPKAFFKPSVTLSSASSPMASQRSLKKQVISISFHGIQYVQVPEHLVPADTKFTKVPKEVIAKFYNKQLHQTIQEVNCQLRQSFPSEDPPAKSKSKSPPRHSPTVAHFKQIVRAINRD